MRQNAFRVGHHKVLTLRDLLMEPSLAGHRSSLRRTEILVLGVGLPVLYQRCCPVGAVIAPAELMTAIEAPITQKSDLLN